jgi:hypothetical protein
MNEEKRRRACYPLYPYDYSNWKLRLKVRSARKIGTSASACVLLLNDIAVLTAYIIQQCHQDSANTHTWNKAKSVKYILLQRWDDQLWWTMETDKWNKNNWIDKNKTNSAALVRQRTIPTERPPLIGEVRANFSGYRMSRGHRNKCPRPLISVF